jgi:hypothetical protein
MDLSESQARRQTEEEQRIDQVTRLLLVILLLATLWHFV